MIQRMPTSPGSQATAVTRPCATAWVPSGPVISHRRTAWRPVDTTVVASARSGPVRAGRNSSIVKPELRRLGPSRLPPQNENALSAR